MELSTSRRPHDEVAFANHIFEFVRFYNNHRLFCDQIAGIKAKQIKNGNEEVLFFINESNFLLAIRKLSAFVIDNLHYIKDHDDVVLLQRSIEELEEDFLSNRKFQELISQKSRGTEEEVFLQKDYFRYLIRCFNIANDLVFLLQNSLMISTSDVKKYVSYHNSTQFFENLSYYREEMSNDISQFNLGDALQHIKKLLGFTYSYKILLKEEEKEVLGRIEGILIDYLLDEETLDNIAQAKKKNYSDMSKLVKDSKRLRKLTEFCYYYTNKCLSDRNILPKIKRKIFIDKTTI
jgi:hypothetical protein